MKMDRVADESERVESTSGRRQRLWRSLLTWADLAGTFLVHILVFSCFVSLVIWFSTAIYAVIHYHYMPATTDLERVRPVNFVFEPCQETVGKCSFVTANVSIADQPLWPNQFYSIEMHITHPLWQPAHPGGMVMVCLTLYDASGQPIRAPEQSNYLLSTSQSLSLHMCQFELCRSILITPISVWRYEAMALMRLPFEVVGLVSPIFHSASGLTSTNIVFASNYRDLESGTDDSRHSTVRVDESPKSQRQSCHVPNSFARNDCQEAVVGEDTSVIALPSAHKLDHLTVEVRSRFWDIHSASIFIYAHYTGLRHLLHRHPVFSFCLGVFGISALVLCCTIFCYRALLIAILNLVVGKRRHSSRSRSRMRSQTRPEVADDVKAGVSHDLIKREDNPEQIKQEDGSESQTEQMDGDAENADTAVKTEVKIEEIKEECLSEVEECIQGRQELDDSTSDDYESRLIRHSTRDYN